MSATMPVARRRLSAAWWVVIVVLLVLIGGAGTLLAAGWNQKEPLDPDSAGPQGTLALATILREHGVEVVIARDRAAALDALGAAADRGATLVLPDAPMLSDESLTALAAEAGDVVLIAPRARTARLFFEAGPRGVAPDEAVAPACDVDAAVRAGAIVPRALFDAGDADAACYPSGDGFGLLVTDDDGGVDGSGRTALVDGAALFTNEALAGHGNASLAIGLVARHPIVVWYMPSLADSDIAAPPTVGDLTPPWVTPAIVLLVIAAAAAAVWRGRRFGPLVAENLPVTVRASETLEGRARLYARSRDAAHAAAALRTGALARIARRLGLGPQALADPAARAAEIADATAARIGAPHPVVRGILIDTVPRTDAELVALSDRIRDLEAAVDTAVRAERSTP